MSDKYVHCPKCGHRFKDNSGVAGKAVGGLGGAALGAKIGAGIGIVAGPLGGIAGTVPGAIIGGLAGLWGGDQVADNAKCPQCGKSF